MKAIGIFILFAHLALVGLSGTALAQSDTKADSKTAAQAKVTAIGALRCTSCDLKAAKAAATQCSIYGCQFAFKTEKVTDENGARVKDYEGKIYHIIRNDRSKDLAHNEHKKKRYEVKGKIYDDERVLEVASFAELK